MSVFMYLILVYFCIYDRLFVFLTFVFLCYDNSVVQFVFWVFSSFYYSHLFLCFKGVSHRHTDIVSH